MTGSVLHALIGEFGAAVGLDDLAFDDEQRCNLMFDDVAVSLEVGAGDSSLYIYSVLGPEPALDAEQRFAELLKANYAFAQTGGATLALDPAGGGIVLMREEPLETLRLPRLESVIEDFVNVAERLIANLSAGALAGPAPEAAVESGGQGEGQSPPPVGGTMRV